LPNLWLIGPKANRDPMAESALIPLCEAYPRRAMPPARWPQRFALPMGPMVQ